MAKYYKPKLTEAQYFFVLNAMGIFLYEIQDQPSEERMWKKTYAALMLTQENTDGKA
tara:strand:+ start:242 stop:412 length:171 start_codon:yes stop_codon:yes gene_type:complete